VHGTRNEIGLTSVAADWTPIFETELVVISESRLFSSLCSRSHTIRAPPAVYFL
jgi:hypothetical protein